MNNNYNNDVSVDDSTESDHYQRVRTELFPKLLVAIAKFTQKKSKSSDNNNNITPIQYLFSKPLIHAITDLTLNYIQHIAIDSEHFANHRLSESVTNSNINISLADLLVTARNNNNLKQQLQQFISDNALSSPIITKSNTSKRKSSNNSKSSHNAKSPKKKRPQMKTEELLSDEEEYSIEDELSEEKVAEDEAEEEEELEDEDEAMDEVEISEDGEAEYDFNSKKSHKKSNPRIESDDDEVEFV